MWVKIFINNPNQQAEGLQIKWSGEQNKKSKNEAKTERKQKGQNLEDKKKIRVKVIFNYTVIIVIMWLLWLCMSDY